MTNGASNFFPAIGSKYNSCHATNSGQFCSDSESFAEGNGDSLSSYYNLDKNCGTKIDCESIKTYTKSGYKGVNTALRKGTYDQGWSKAEVDGLQKGLDKTFSNAPTVPENIVVYRGMSPRLLTGLNPGDTFIDNGYTSTTISKNASYRGTKVQIRVPKGTKGIYIAKVSSFPNEKELLLNRGLKFRLVNSENDMPTWEVVNE